MKDLQRNVESYSTRNFRQLRNGSQPKYSIPHSSASNLEDKAIQCSVITVIFNQRVGKRLSFILCRFLLMVRKVPSQGNNVRFKSSKRCMKKEERACQTCKHKYLCLEQMRTTQGTLCDDDKLEQYEPES